MSQNEQMLFLFQYHFDTISHLMNQARKLSPEEYRDDFGIKWGSIHELLFHILATDQGYRVALKTGQRPPPLRSEDFTDLDSLQVLLESEQSDWTTFLQELDDSQVEEVVEMRAGPERIFRFPRWIIFQHVLLHGMQHQADIAARLTEFGQSPGDLDLVFYRG